ncbi:malate synthase G [Pyruvatibacter mobilis]|uniref:malate synthase G n=1 Tax=Pyruvatibacter mobilis TaxID=1712261 RepID=UPI003C7E6B7F
MDYLEKDGIRFAAPLVEFVDSKCIPGSGLTADAFWAGAAKIFKEFSGENDRLLQVREDLQAKIDAWHEANPGPITDHDAYEAFLREIGYIVPEPEPFKITTANVDPEIATMAGPQLVVPSLNARFVLNAANARWGSLYDAFYGTDALPGEAKGPGYDEERGAQVVDKAKSLLDEFVPLASGSHKDVTGYKVVNGALEPALKDPSLFAGFTGLPDNPDSVLFKQNGLHIQVLIDRSTNVGSTDPAGVTDILMEAALTTIVDLEDSVAAVDCTDKIDAYTNWLGLMNGDLEETFQKGGKPLTRSLNGDKDITTPDGKARTLQGRSTLLVRNVGHLMKTEAVLLEDGSQAPEGVMDALITNLISLRDVGPEGRRVNSPAGSIYVVKPKMHGPEEVAFTDRLFAAVEDLLGLARNTIKVGVMDEERRTSANLAACIKAVSGRIVFINTGFLDRTGDEIHTSMKAGAMIPKTDMKGTDWIAAYEERNVAIGLACGLSGKAQIGKGMWAAPDRMGDMLEQKIGHPKTGANTAWVPSPTAATLHAIHYHQVDVMGLRDEIAKKPCPSLKPLLSVPLAKETNWPADVVERELENNAQGILGYVVRWIDQGVGCSKVPDINDIGLMEDRATLRISSQHMANWLMHGICTKEQVDAAFERMAKKVDEQNAGDAAYEPMAPKFDGLAFEASKALVFEGAVQPSGYTEPLLHAFRVKKKAEQGA